MVTKWHTTEAKMAEDLVHELAAARGVGGGADCGRCRELECLYEQETQKMMATYALALEKMEHKVLIIAQDGADAKQRLEDTEKSLVSAKAKHAQEVEAANRQHNLLLAEEAELYEAAVSELEEKLLQAKHQGKTELGEHPPEEGARGEGRVEALV